MHTLTLIFLQLLLILTHPLTNNCPDSHHRYLDLSLSKITRDNSLAFHLTLYDSPAILTHPLTLQGNFSKLLLRDKTGTEYTYLGT
jgi:hypothetical protein